MRRGKRWNVRVSRTAQADMEAILQWTQESFGNRQVRTYYETLMLAMRALHDGPEIPGVRQRPAFGAGWLTLHVARRNRKGRHFLVCRTFGEAPSGTIEVIRILHDAMDLERHIPPVED